MTCDEARETFSDLYDGRLTGAALADLDQHLEACATCRTDWDAFLRAIQMVAELGTAEPSPGFAARARERIEAPTWWQRAIHALFLPLQVKIPMQAVAVAVVTLVGVIIYQKSPDVMQAPRRETSPSSPSARPAEPASRAGEPSAPAAPPASPAPPVGSVLEDRRDVPGQSGAASPPASLEGQAGPRDQAVRNTNVAPAFEKDGADGLTGSLDATKRPAKEPLPARQQEQQESQATQYPYTAPERGGAPAALPAPEASSRARPAPREKAKEEEKGLGKKMSPADAEPAKTAETRDEFRRSMEAESKAAAPAPPPALQRQPEAPGQPRERLAVIPRGSADDLYSAAITEYARREYDRAVESFRAFLAQHPRDPRVPDARYWVADSYFQQQRYAEAIPEYEAVIRQFPDSRRAPAALFRQALARLAVGDPAGCQILRDAVSRYPQAAEAGRAREALAARCP